MNLTQQKQIENPHWNMANATCEDCSATWGHCGSKYEGRYKKFNERVNNTLKS